MCRGERQSKARIAPSVGDEEFGTAVCVCTECSTAVAVVWGPLVHIHTAILGSSTVRIRVSAPPINSRPIFQSSMITRQFQPERYRRRRRGWFRKYLVVSFFFPFLSVEVVAMTRIRTCGILYKVQVCKYRSVEKKGFSSLIRENGWSPPCTRRTELTL